MSEMMDAMRHARPERIHPAGALVCTVCQGKGWLKIEFQAEFCRDRGTEQTRDCKECKETGLMDPARYAMLALQGQKANDDWKPYPTDDRMFTIHGRCGITFRATWVWTGLDWLEYENPFYVRSRAEGRTP